MFNHVLNFIFKAQQLINDGYLRNRPIQGSFGCIIELTQKSEQYLSAKREDQEKCEKIMLFETKEMKQNSCESKLSIKLNYGPQ